MTMKELGHPQTSNLAALWQKGLLDVQMAERLRNRDNLTSVVREEDLPSTLLGAV
jgi:hypothetical protein